MIPEAEFLCERSISSVGEDVQYLCVPKPPPVLPNEENNLFDISPIICQVEVNPSDSLSIDFSLPSESVVNFSTSIQTPLVESSSTRKFIPRVRSGSHTDKGPRKSNDDQHITIDDLSVYLGSPLSCPLPSAFYAVFDGHGGPQAATYLKNNAIRLFFEDTDQLPLIFTDSSLEDWENSHRKAFLMADQALANKCNNVSASCGTTALTALVLGGYLLIANAGDCRAVLCRKGVAVQMSQDHTTSSLPERTRVEELGGCIEYGFLNGELSVTRALGDWHMKSLHGPMSPLIAEPEFQKVILTEDDEFLIIGCDGIWDVMSNQEAVSLVRRELRRHDDPNQCAQELVNLALHLHSTDNLTAIIVCFTSRDSLPPQRPRLRCCSLSEEARNTLRSLLEGN